MDFDIDQSRLLYGLGAFLGVISIIYFGQELILNLSPTIKSIILLTGTAGFLSAGEYVQNGTLRSSFYIFSAFSYLSFLIYTIFRFQFSSEETFLLLAVSSAVFIGLGYMRSGKGFELDREKAKMVLVAASAVIAVLVVVDVLGPQPEYDLDLEETVEVVDREEFQIGTLEIRNDFVLSRSIDVPTYRGCVGGVEMERIYIRSEVENGLIAGSETKRIELTDTVGTPPDHNRTISGNYTVVNGECPDNSEEGTIYIQESGIGNKEAVEAFR